MSQPTLPALPALKLPPEVATILAMLFGATMTVLTSAGVTPANATAIIAALQYVLYAGIAIAGLLGHLHLHNQHVSLARAAMEINGVQSAVQSAPDAQVVTLPPPPATTAPASPSYAVPDAPQLAQLPAIGGGMTITPQFPPSTVISSSSAPQPPSGDTPTQVVAKVADAPPATPQATTEASAT